MLQHQKYFSATFLFHIDQKQEAHRSGCLKNPGSESRLLLVGTLTKQENGFQLQCSVWCLKCPEVIDYMLGIPGGQQRLCVSTGLVPLFTWPCPPVTQPLYSIRGKWHRIANNISVLRFTASFRGICHFSKTWISLLTIRCAIEHTLSYTYCCFWFF